MLARGVDGVEADDGLGAVGGLMDVELAAAAEGALLDGRQALSLAEEVLAGALRGRVSRGAED
jgi:hypothetical protein